MKKVIRINETGLFIEDILIEEGQEVPIDCVETVCQEGFYKPKWNGFKWIEGLTDVEIYAVKNIVIPKTDIGILQENQVLIQKAVADLIMGGM